MSGRQAAVERGGSKRCVSTAGGSERCGGHGVQREAAGERWEKEGEDGERFGKSLTFFRLLLDFGHINKYDILE